MSELASAGSKAPPTSETIDKEDIPLKLKKSEAKEARHKSKDSRSKKEKEAITNANRKTKEGSRNQTKPSVVSQTLQSEPKAENDEGAGPKKSSAKSETSEKRDGLAGMRRASRGAADRAKQRMSSQSNARGDEEEEEQSDEEKEMKKTKRKKTDRKTLSDSTLSEDDDDDQWYERRAQSIKQTNDEKKSREIKSETESADDETLVVKKKASFKKEKKIEAKKKVDGKQNAKSGSAKKRARKRDDDDDDDDEIEKKTVAKKVKKESSSSAKVRKKNADVSGSPKKKVKEEPEIWKWWEEDRTADGVKWRTLSHKGPYFAAPYEPVPDSVQLLYKGKPFKLSPLAEETAGFFARMLDHEYTSKPVFKENFWTDWRKVMTAEEREKIKKFEHCDFTVMHKYFVQKAEEKKQMSKEEKKKIKEQNEALQEEYGFCLIDGHKQKIGNWKIEPPGLFRGRGEHPKMGKLKRRIHPEDVTINIGKEAKLPVPPTGRWGEVRHDNKVTWLATWIDTVNGERKYVLLNAASHLKGEKDWQKYETARKLKGNVDRIREEYRRDWKSKLMQDRQRGVAVYFIDKLALRAGNEKDTDEEADTVGCCSLRVEHIRLHDTWEGKDYVVEFDFLGKDSIRYINHIAVEKQVFKNLRRFVEQKDPEDDLFDRITTTSLNKYLQSIMPGLTAKVFRTYNASITLQEQLKALTQKSMSISERLLAYNRANRQVAILCNHQRSIPKTFDKQMERLGDKIKEKEEKITAAEKELKSLKKSGSSEVGKKKSAIDRLKTQLHKLEVQQTDKEENKTIALGTSKLNYLDPRITVAWCKEFDVPVEKIYNKTQREKFIWAIHMTDETFEF